MIDYFETTLRCVDPYSGIEVQIGTTLLKTDIFRYDERRDLNFLCLFLNGLCSYVHENFFDSKEDVSFRRL